MKIRNKIFLMLTILMLVALFVFTESVLAVGNIYQSWINVDSSNKRYLLYRTYVAPAYDSVVTYTNRVNNWRKGCNIWTEIYVI